MPAAAAPCCALLPGNMCDGRLWVGDVDAGHMLSPEGPIPSPATSTHGLPRRISYD